MQEGVLILFASSVSCFLLARTVAGPCGGRGNTEVNIWDSQRCNPMATVFMTPIDQVFATLVAVPVFQLFIKGVSGMTVVAAWVIIITTSNMALHIAKANTCFVWTNIAFIMVCGISYEIERMMLVRFINKVNLMLQLST
jgi:hypothetical protein